MRLKINIIWVGFKRDLTNFFKWMALAILTGVVVAAPVVFLPYVSGG